MTIIAREINLTNGIADRTHQDSESRVIKISQDTPQKAWMKPLRLVCFSTFLLRSCLLRDKAFSSQPQSESHQLCARPKFPWLGYFTSAQCVNPDRDHYSSCRRHSSMSQPGFDYAKHNISRLIDLPIGSEPMDVIIAGKRGDAKEHIIFFGGDVQDYPENMQSHRDNGKYIRWNSESTAGRLCERFPTALVLVVKPHHMHLKTFSVYSQFVKSNDFGCPTHTPDFGAWQTLAEVYEEAVGKALGSAQEAHTNNDDHSGDDGHNKAGAAEESSTSPGDQKTSNAQSSQTATQQSEGTVVDQSPGNATTNIPNVSVHLIGFSKGCIVLNQLVHELESVQNIDRVQRFIARVQAMTWLDGGHSGGSNTWVTDQAALGQLAALGINIHVHVTPYQVKDPMRRWIGKEKRRFVELLQKAGARMTDKLHFEDEPKSIENHFRVLEDF